MDEWIKAKVIKRFKARKFLFKTMHILELYLAFEPNNTLDIVVKMENRQDLDEERDSLAVFFAAIIGFQLNLTYYIIEIDTYENKNKLVRI